MHLRQLNEILNKRGLSKPDLDALRPNIDDYQVLLYQPLGRVFGSPTRVGNMNTDTASEQCYAMCRTAVSEGAQLFVAPEYSFPWPALGRCLDEGITPPLGALWVLGCESISFNELEAFIAAYKDRLETIHEDIAQLDRAGKTFLDPVVYLFRTTTADGAAKLVAVVQFKTHPSIDPERIEGDNLCLGKTVYVLGEVGLTTRLVTFICSDVFKVDNACAGEVYDRALILHIQLNPNPRETTYLQYRRILMGLTTHETEIICLNWSQSVKEWVDDGNNHVKLKRWRNISGSAWYLRPDKFDGTDSRIASNHRAGLYYTYLAPKWHALFFNYSRKAYLIKTSKVWHRNVAAVQSKRTGPRVVRTLTWNWGAQSWCEATSVCDAFVPLLSGWGAATQPLVDLHEASPLYVERILAGRGN
ncbi:hypothetical protein, partial [Paraburkholderia ribeironis]|uniref:hypothetical protein n=1 Tax=Paraburkholderia ribeironis TaxID=1247936 RepID=UPI000B9D5283